MGKEATYILMEGGLPTEKSSEYERMIQEHPRTIAGVFNG